MYQSHMSCLAKKKFCEGIQNRLRFIRIWASEIVLHSFISNLEDDLIQEIQRLSKWRSTVKFHLLHPSSIYNGRLKIIIGAS